MLPLRWSERAVEDLGAIADYISASSPVYAEGVVHRLESRLLLLRSQPAMGKVAREIQHSFVRELVVAPYRIFYRLRDDCIEILAIVHGRIGKPDAG